MASAAEVEPLYASVGKAIRAVRGDMSQDELADAIGKNQRTLSAYEDGVVRIPLHLIPEIEVACGARQGDILRKAGLVDESVEAVISGDPSLSDYGREAVVGFYLYTRDQFRPGRAQP